MYGTCVRILAAIYYGDDSFYVYNRDTSWGACPGEPAAILSTAQTKALPKHGATIPVTSELLNVARDVSRHSHHNKDEILHQNVR